MNITLFEDYRYRQLLPLVWMRGCFELRCGVDRLIDKVRRHFGGTVVRLWVRPTLLEVVDERFELPAPSLEENWCLLNSRVLITDDVSPPPPGVCWVLNGDPVALALDADAMREVTPELFHDESRMTAWMGQFRQQPPPGSVRMIRFPWDLILANGSELRRQCRSGGAHQGRIYPGAHLLNPSEIFIGDHAVIKPGVVLDAEAGPIHIDRNVLIEPNAVIQGPCYIGPKSVVRPTATIRENTSLGPVCKVGGEVEGSILQGFSNKQHDGFLGHSYVGSWVNLGADTITSDLKNTYGTIRVSLNGVGVESGQHFIGSIIGDHAKTGIGTILPTGCVLGLAANVFTRAPVPKFVPSFAWLTDAGLSRYRVDKAVDLARRVMARRELVLSDAEGRLLQSSADVAAEVESAGWASADSEAS